MTILEMSCWLNEPVVRELQNHWGWKGLLENIESNPAAKSRFPK